MSTSILDQLSEIKKEVSKFALKYEKRIKFWIGNSAYDLRTDLEVLDKPEIVVTYMVARANLDYEDYQTCTRIPLEYFEIEDYEDYKNNLDQEAKIKAAEQKLKEYQNQIWNIDVEIKHLKEKKTQILKWMKP